MNIFFVTLYQPLYNLLVWLYDISPVATIGLPIIAITILIKGVLFPLTYKSLKSQKELQEIQPKIKEIQEKYKEDRERLAKELMGIYKEHNVNPFASCLPLLIQLPIFLSLFRVLQNGLKEVNADHLYAFVPNPGAVETMFLGMDLAAISLPLAVLTAIAQYFQAKQTITRRPDPAVRKKEGAQDEDMMASMNKVMLYFIPGLSLILGATSLPGGVMLYWLITTLLTLLLYTIFLPNKQKV